MPLVRRCGRYDGQSAASDSVQTDPLCVKYRALCLATVLFVCSVLGTAVSGEDPPTEQQEATWITSIAPVDSSGQFVAATATSLLLREADVVIFSAGAPDDLTTLYSHPAAVWCVASTRDGQKVASVDYRGNLVTYDFSNEEARTHENAFDRWCQSMVVSPDDRFVVAGNEDGQVMSWDLEADEVVHTVELDGSAVTDLMFSPDGKRIAASDRGGHVHLLEWPALEPIGNIEVSDEPCWAVAWIDEGDALMVGSGDRHLYRVAAMPDAKPTSVAKGSNWITEVDVSPGGQVAAADVGGRVLLPFDGGTESMQADSGVWALQWNGDGQLLVGTRKHGIALAGRSWSWASSVTSPAGTTNTSLQSDEPGHD